MRIRTNSVNPWLAVAAVVALMGSCVAPAVFAHKYYFGHTSIELNEKSNRLEVIHEYSTHDLEYALTAIIDDKVNLEMKQGEEALKTYIHNKFKMTSGGHIVALNWVGMEQDHNLVTVYQESGKFNGDELTLHNSVLLDQFPSQVNLINLKIRGLKSSLKFDKSKDVHSIDLRQE